MDTLIKLCGQTVPNGHTGAGRENYDGRFHVLGFYMLGIEEHMRNYIQLGEHGCLHWMQGTKAEQYMKNFQSSEIRGATHKTHPALDALGYAVVALENQFG